MDERVSLEATSANLQILRKVCVQHAQVNSTWLQLQHQLAVLACGRWPSAVLGQHPTVSFGKICLLRVPLLRVLLAEWLFLNSANNKRWLVWLQPFSLNINTHSL